MTEMNATILYEQYQNQIYKLALHYRELFYRMPYKGYEWDDIYQIACEGFVKAIYSYNEEKGTVLQTHIYNCIKNTLINELNSERSKKRDDRGHYHLSLQYTIDNGEGDLTSVSELIGEEDPRFCDIDNKLALQTIADYIEQQFSEKDLRILKKYFIDGKSGREIATECGVSHPLIYFKINKMKALLKEYFTEEEIAVLVS